MKITTILIIFLAVSLITIIPKPAQSQMTFKDAADDVLVIGINTGMYALIGGIGAIIHKKPFLEGAKKGAPGGVIIGAAKFMVAKDYRLGWPSKFANSFGTSIVVNTVKGKEMFASLGMDMGPLYIEFNKSDGKYRFNPEIWLGSATSLVVSCIKADQFDWKLSLITGTPTFRKNDFSLFGMENVGVALTNIVWIPDSAEQHTTYSHEIVHTYQSSSIASLGALILGNGDLMKANNMLHIRAEEDYGSIISWLPETFLVPNNLMYREYEADSFVDFFPTRPNKRIWDY